MTKTRLLFCLSAAVMIATPVSVSAQKASKSQASLEVRQQCINEVQSRLPVSGTNNSNREREMAYFACVTKQGVRP